MIWAHQDPLPMLVGRALARSLSDAGCSRSDAAVAVGITLMIDELDRLVFPHRPACVIPKPCTDLRRGALAGYWPESDSYVVYAFNLAMRAKHAARKRYVRFGRPVSIREFMVAVAVHEVRHRLQYHVGGLRMWDFQDAPSGELAIAHRIAYDRHMPELAAATTPEDATIAQRELDAQVIECVAVNRMDGLMSPRDLADLVWMEP